MDNRSFDRTTPMELSGYYKESYRNGRLVIHARNVMTTISTTDIVPAYKLLYNAPLSPATFGNSRLAAMADLYERFQFKKARFCFVTGASDGDRGRLCMSYDNDPSDETPPEDQSGYNTYTNHAVSKEFSLKKNADILFVSKKENELFTNASVNGDERLFDQGQLYVVSSTAIDAEVTPYLGSIWVEYEIELWEPQLQSKNEGATVYIQTNDTVSPNTNVFGLVNNRVTTSRNVKIQGSGADASMFIPAGQYLYNTFVRDSGAGGEGGQEFATPGPVLVQANNKNTIVPTLLNASSGQTAAHDYPGVGSWFFDIPSAGALLKQMTPGVAITSALSAFSLNKINSALPYKINLN